MRYEVRVAENPDAKPVTVSVPIDADAIPESGSRREQLAALVGEMVLRVAEADVAARGLRREA